MYVPVLTAGRMVVVTVDDGVVVALVVKGVVVSPSVIFRAARISATVVVSGEAASETMSRGDFFDSVCVAGKILARPPRVSANKEMLKDRRHLVKLLQTTSSLLQQVKHNSHHSENYCQSLQHMAPYIPSSHHRSVAQQHKNLS